MSLVTPTTIVSGTIPLATALNTFGDSISQLQGGSPTAGPLDCALLRQTVTQNLTSATFTSITFDVEDLDVANGHSTITNTSRYTVQVAGLIQVEVGLAFAPNSAGSRGLQILKSGVATQGRVFHAPTPAAPGALQTEISHTRTIQCVVGDYIEVQGYQNSGGALATAYASPSVGCFMNVRWVHS